MFLILVAVGVTAVAGFSFGFFSGLVWAQMEFNREEQENREHEAWIAAVKVDEDSDADPFDGPGGPW